MMNLPSAPVSVVMAPEVTVALLTGLLLRSASNPKTEPELSEITVASLLAAFSFLHLQLITIDAIMITKAAILFACKGFIFFNYLC